MITLINKIKDKAIELLTSDKYFYLIMIVVIGVLIYLLVKSVIEIYGNLKLIGQMFLGG